MEMENILGKRKREIIGISGFKGNGKSTTAEILKNKYGYKLFSFGAAIKDVVSARYGIPRDILEGDTPESRIKREEPDEYWTKEMANSESYLSTFKDGIVTPRRLLEFEGTEVTKDHIKRDFWISRVKKDLLEYEGDKVAFVDTRYPDEVEFVMDNGGELIWIQRFDPPWLHLSVDEIKEQYPELHRSEYAWLKYREKYVPINNKRKREDLDVSIENHFCVS
jgi:hypothetical protein